MPKIVQMDSIKGGEIIEQIKEGAIFIYPTDTVYGLGCNALDADAVKRLRKIKGRSNKPLSIIAPSKAWITRNFETKKSYINKLPGPYTFIMKPKKEKLLPDEVTKGVDTVGVRIPDHPFTKIIQKAGVPFITTSVNISGEAPVTDLSKIPSEILNNVDYIIGDNSLDNAPSALIDLTGEIPKIIKRGTVV
ncbi:MAG: L-threonylcarbamoyladenylate synthase [archaeon]